MNQDSPLRPPPRRARAGSAIGPLSRFRNTSSATYPTPVSYQGVDDGGTAPSDSTGAIGTTRYMELVNDQYAIYDRSGNSISNGDLGGLTAVDSSHHGDPQIFWDYSSDRFYYV